MKKTIRKFVAINEATHRIIRALAFKHNTSQGKIVEERFKGVKT